MKSNYILLYIYLISAIGIAQTPQLPNVVPPTPQTAEFTKYIDFPANLSLGIPSTSIPIYTIQTTELNLPISFSYDASGLKPNEDESGLIGLKWSLNAFGVVSRAVNNRADEQYWEAPIPVANDLAALPNICGPTANIYGQNYNNQYGMLNSISLGQDAEPDVFSYRLPNGESNKFVFSRGSTINQFQPIMLKVTSTKLQHDSSTNQLNYFDITDTKGVAYRFGQNLSNTSSATEGGSKGRTSWLLTEMISPTKKDTIYFEYDDVQFENIISPGQFMTTKRKYSTTQEMKYVTIERSIPVGSGGVENYSWGDNRYPIEYNYSQKKITKIRFKSGYITFHYQFLDNKCFLQYIRIFTTGNILTKTIELKQSKFANVTTDRLNWYKLDEIVIHDKVSVEKQKYLFNYITGTFPKRTLYSTYAVDHWGFYNGKNGNNSLIPNNIDLSWPEASMGPGYGGDRSPDGAYSKIGMLESITLPTKGIRIFDYEGNTSNNNPIGGIRIKKITNADGNDQLIHTYDYGSGGQSKDISTKDYYRDYSYIFQNEIHSERYLSETFTLNSEPNFDIFMNGAPVVYQTVDEYIGTQINNLGKIRHTFSGGVPAFSPNIADYVCGDFMPGAGPPYDQQAYSQPITIYYYHNVYPDINEGSTTYYNAQNEVVKKIENFYDTSSTGEVLKGFRSKRIITLMYVLGGPTDSCNHFYFYNYSFYQSQQKFLGTKVTEYKNNLPTIFTTTGYQYNDKNLISSETTTNSLGQILKKEYKYPTELVGVEQSPYMAQLVASNRIAVPVITKTYNGTDKLSENHVKYESSSATSNIILPIEVHTSKGAGDINISTVVDRKIMYSKYDTRGNIQEYKLDNGTPVCIIWGYNGTLPLAKIENATYSQVLLALSTTESALMASTTAPATIRTALPAAMITTYTYSPLVGVSTVTDPRGYTTTYEYDNSGRLKNVKDAQGNILSENEYNYKQ